MQSFEVVLSLAHLRADIRTGRARLIRERARVSQAEIGNAIGTSGSAVAQWEAGRRLPRGERALCYARLLAELERQHEERQAGAGPERGGADNLDLNAEGLLDAGYGGGYEPESDLVLVARARRLLQSGTARRIRERAGVKRAELAKAAGITVPTLARWEAAARVPYGEHAVQYARLLAELAELIGAGSDDLSAA